MKHTKGEKVFQVFNIIIMLLVCCLMVYPYLNQVAISFNEGIDAMKGGIGIFPREFTWANYKAIFSTKSMYTGAVVSVSITVLHTLLCLVVLFASAYGITRRGLPYRRGLTLFLMLPCYVSAGVVPTYIIYRYLGLINSYWIYILPGCFSFYNMVILRSFLQELPASIEESAKLDGANDIQIMYKIALPLSKPVLATITLWVAVGRWNNWTDAMMYITDRKLFPLSYIMMQLIKESSLAQQMADDSGMITSVAKPTPDTIKAATLVVTTLPIIMVYPFLQKYFIKGVTLGAVKG
ncbi:MAG: carbohydrate ABC transporter permease [Clostridia bacterium]|nr:carbohydrate ABC transporter permease [Clostridia bacterium]